MRGRVPRCRSLVAGGGALLAMLALGAALAWQKIFNAVLSAQLTLTPESRSFHDWRAPDTPIYMEVFMFNWTNADEFPREKPQVQELGPYRFREHRTHVNLTWNHHNGSIGYRTHLRYHFDPEGSIGTLEDQITTLNMAKASAKYIQRSSPIAFLVDVTLAGVETHVTKTAGELLFEGYEEPLMDLAKLLPEQYTRGAPILDRLGLFYGRNNSIDSEGYMEVSTGADDGLPGQVLRWNYKDHIPFYEGKCRKLEGSAGEFIRRNLTPDSTLEMFIPNLCRTVNMEYVDSGDLDGLPYHKFELNQRSFDNSTLDPSNSCFCKGPCMWSGVMNVSACRYDSPTFISLPHFLYGDPMLQDMVTGLDPDPEKHGFYFSIQPDFGVPMDVAARFQLNMYVEEQESWSIRPKTQILFPIMWVQQHVTIEESVRAELRFARNTLEWGCIVLSSIAFVLAALVTLSTCCTKRRPKYAPPVEAIEKPVDWKPKEEKPRNEKPNEEKAKEEVQLILNPM